MLSLKLKLIHHASIHPVHFGEFSFSPMYGQISRNDAFGRCGCLPWTWLGRFVKFIGIWILNPSGGQPVVFGLSGNPKAKVLCIAKTWRCEVVGSQQFSQSIPASCCVREDLALLIVDLTFHGQCQWHLFQVQRQPPCSHGFACLGSKRSSLADRTGATIEVVVARCNKCSSKLCLFFGPVEPRSLQQMWLQKNYNFGAATSYHEGPE